MTYKEIINRIRTVAQNHLMIKDFGYGERLFLKYDELLPIESLWARLMKHKFKQA